MTPHRIAVFNIESYSSGLAMERLIERLHGRIAAVVVSVKQNRKKTLTQALEHWRRSGWSFVCFLLFNFTFYCAMLHILRGMESIFGYQRGHFSLRELCERYSIAYFESANVNSAELRRNLEAARVDLILVFYFDQILRSSIIALPQYGAVNAHTAMLPRYRGLFPVVQMTLRGDNRFGTTVHEIADQRIDAGAILMQAECEVPDGLVALDKSRHVHAAGVDLIGRVLQDFPRLWKERREQGEGDYYSFPEKQAINEAVYRGVRLTSTRHFLAEMLRRRGSLGSQSADFLETTRGDNTVASTDEEP